MLLSKDFSLSEFTLSATALSKNIKNEPNAKQLDAIKQLVSAVLQPARSTLGMVIAVTSGFRSKALNEIIGGANGSQHSKGEAADIQCNDNARLFNYIASHCVFDQLIWEFGDDQQPDWVHVSYKAGGENRAEKLRAVRINGVVKYETL